MSAERWAKWEKTRSRGRDRFVWLWGVCFFGLWMTVGGIVAVLSTKHPAPEFMVCVVLLLGPFSGWLWGQLVWTETESRYLAWKAEEERTVAIGALTREVKELREALERPVPADPSRSG